MTTIVFTAIGILVLIALGSLGLLAAITISALHNARAFLLQSGLDVIQLYAAANSAKMDVLERESRFELSREFGQLQIQKQRFELLGPELGGNER